MRNPIIVALDMSDADQAVSLAASLAPHVGAFKVGKELFTRTGPSIVSRLRAEGANVFLDLKFHDIPNTVAKAVTMATALNVQFLTIHTSGGSAMMRAAEEAAQKAAASNGANPPLVLGVTVLTSLDEVGLHELGVQGSVEDHVARLAKLAVSSGLRGLVCSPLELPMLRRILPPSTQLVTPGIRAANAPKDDQRRTLGPVEAIENGADWLVIGRPICAAQDPRQAAVEFWDAICSSPAAANRLADV